MAVGGRAGGASREITAPGNVVRMSSLHISFFSVLIPHALSSFFALVAILSFPPFFLVFDGSGGVHPRAGAVLRDLRQPDGAPAGYFAKFLHRSQSCPFRAGLLPFWCSTGHGRASEGGRCSSPRSKVCRSFVFILVYILFEFLTPFPPSYRLGQSAILPCVCTVRLHFLFVVVYCQFEFL